MSAWLLQMISGSCCFSLSSVFLMRLRSVLYNNLPNDAWCSNSVEVDGQPSF